MKKIFFILPVLVSYTLSSSQEIKPAASKSLTPLMQAVIEDNVDSVQKIANKEHSINAQDTHGETALHWAVNNNNLKMIQLLLDIPGININIENDDGFTPLALAVNQRNLEIVTNLIKAGADINTRSFKGKKKIINWHEEQAHKKHSDLSSFQRLKKNILHKPNTHYNNKLIKQIAGYTPLMLAVQAGSDEIVNTLLQSGADPAAKAIVLDEKGQIKIDKPSGKIMLITAQDISQKRNKNIPALAEALKKWNERGEKLIELIENGKKEDANELLNQPLNVNKINQYGETPLLAAIRKDYIEIIEKLLKNNADPNLITHHTYNLSKWAPLHQAASQLNAELVSKLISAGAQVNQPLTGGDTAFSIAARNYPNDQARQEAYKKTLNVLVKAGANINNINSMGETPYDSIVKLKNKDAADFLRSLGAKTRSELK